MEGDILSYFIISSHGRPVDIVINRIDSYKSGQGNPHSEFFLTQPDFSKPIELNQKALLSGVEISFKMEEKGFVKQTVHGNGEGYDIEKLALCGGMFYFT